MKILKRCGIGLLFIVISWFGLTALHRHLDPNEHKSDEEREDAFWISSSKHWLDRQACRWMGICGLAHWHPDPAVRPWNKQRAGLKNVLMNVQDGEGEEYEEIEPEDEEEIDSQYVWDRIPGQGERLKPGDWDGDARVLKDVPQFVLDHAPLVHLYSGEQFWPSDISEHLTHTTPYRNHTNLHLNNSQHTLHNLH